MGTDYDHHITNVLFTLNQTTPLTETFIIDFLANSYLIVQIHHTKSFKMKFSMSLYLNFQLEYS